MFVIAVRTRRFPTWGNSHTVILLTTVMSCCYAASPPDAGKVWAITISSNGPEHTRVCVCVCFVCEGTEVVWAPLSSV